MFARIRKWWLSWRQPRIWVVRDGYTGVWSKVVTYSRPPSFSVLFPDVIGPFRSEMDAEEYCDRVNGTLVGKFKAYRSDHV